MPIKKLPFSRHCLEDESYFALPPQFAYTSLYKPLQVLSYSISVTGETRCNIIFNPCTAQRFFSTNIIYVFSPTKRSLKDSISLLFSSLLLLEPSIQDRPSIVNNKKPDPKIWSFLLSSFLFCINCMH